MPDARALCGVCDGRGSPGTRAPAVNEPPGEWWQGDVVAGRYEVLSLLGAGPLGNVLRVHDRRAGADATLKAFHPGLVPHAAARAQLLAVLREGARLRPDGADAPLVVATDAGEDCGRAWAVAPLVDAPALRRVLEARRRPFAPAEAERVVAGVAAALEAAHAAGGVHGGVKPENVLVLPERVLLTDFGVTRGLARRGVVLALQGRRAAGYLAPEYLAGAALDARADVYALGVLAGELLAGVVPEAAGVPVLPRTGPALPAGFDALYARTLSPDPDVRPATPADFLEALREVLTRPPVRPVAAPALPWTQDARVPAQEVALRAGQTGPVTQPLPTLLGAPEGGATGPLRITQPLDVLASGVLPTGPVRITQPLPQLGAAGRGALDVTDPLPAPGVTDLPTLRVGLGASHAEDAVPDAGLEPAPAAPVELFRVHRASSGGGGRAQAAALWLALLTGGGLLTGTAGGLSVLRAVRTPAGAHAPRPSPARTWEARPVPDAQSAAATAPAGPVRAPLASAPGRRARGGREDVVRTAPAARAAPRLAADVLPPAEGTAPLRALSAVVVSAPELLETPAPAACPEGMVRVAEGAFRAGSAADDPMMGQDDRPHAVRPVRTFCIDQFEYPNRAGARPAQAVTWSEASAACEAAGKRLCSEDEWEKACKGPGGTRFPYGEFYDARACNTQDDLGLNRVVAVSGRFARCRSGYGVQDLSGNVAEWTGTSLRPGQVVVKGGGFDRKDWASRCGARQGAAPGGRTASAGFRCCADAGN